MADSALPLALPCNLAWCLRHAITLDPWDRDSALYLRYLRTYKLRSLHMSNQRPVNCILQQTYTRLTVRLSEQGSVLLPYSLFDSLRSVRIRYSEAAL